MSTFYLPSGIGATCVLKSAFNSTLDQQVQALNLNSNESKMLAAKYFDAMCLDSFTQGLPLSNFVPPPPSPAPSDYPFSLDEDLLRAWNFTTFPPTVKGTGRHAVGKLFQEGWAQEWLLGGGADPPLSLIGRGS